MPRRFFSALLLGVVTAFTLAGIHTHLRAQEAKPALKNALIAGKPALTKETRPNLREWQFPGMITQNERSYPQIATLTGKAGPNYAEIFDFYARKIGATNYDLKQATTFQALNHALITSVSSADFNTSGNISVDSQTLQATFCHRIEHESVSIFIIKSKPSNVTFISLTSTTF